MATFDSLQLVRARIGERIAEIEARMPPLEPQAISNKMDAIRAIAAEHGLAALEGLADYGNTLPAGGGSARRSLTQASHSQLSRQKSSSVEEPAPTCIPGLPTP